MPVAAGATSAATALTEELPRAQEEVKGRTKEEAQEVKGMAQEVKEATKEEDTEGIREVGATITKAAGAQEEKVARDTKEEVKEDTAVQRDTKEEVKEGTKEVRDGIRQEEVP